MTSSEQLFSDQTGIEEVQRIMLSSSSAILSKPGVKPFHVKFSVSTERYRELYSRILQDRMPDSGIDCVDFACCFDGSRWRAQLYHHDKGWSVAMKRLPNEIASLVDLGFVRSGVDPFTAVRRAGLHIFAGPTDAGKSTTLAAVAQELQKSDQLGLACTLEEPIEFIYESPEVFQRAVGVDVASFADGIREAVRQSVDTIIVGEIRDRDAAHAAVNAGLTGHRVYATLHGDSVINAIGRLFALLDNEHDEILPEALSGVVAQHLLAPRNDGKALLVYESLEATHQVKTFLAEEGAGNLRQLHVEMHKQGRQSLKEQAGQLVQEGKLAATAAEMFKL